MPYLIAKVERKEKSLYLKHEIILYQKNKRSKTFQVKTISKGIRKTIVQSFMFLFDLSKSFVFSVKKMQIYYNFHHWTNEINKHDFLIWSLYFVKVEDKKVAFLIKQGVLFLHICNVLSECRGLHMPWHTSYAKALFHRSLSLLYACSLMYFPLQSYCKKHLLRYRQFVGVSLFNPHSCQNPNHFLYKDTITLRAFKEHEKREMMPLHQN